jgi:hypothetical protein
MRNEQQCLQRFMALERKKGPWAAEEDAALLARLHELSPGMADAAAADDPRSAAEGVRWSLVAAAVPGRTPGQARERWVGCLAPGSGVKRAWTAGEDEALSIAVRAQQDDDAAARGAAASARPRKFWVNVSRALPGRTSKQCDKRWQALHPKELEKRRRAAAIERKARAAPPRPPAEARRTCCRHRCFRKQERDMGARAADAPPLCAQELPQASPQAGSRYARRPVTKLTVNDLDDEGAAPDAAAAAPAGGAGRAEAPEGDKARPRKRGRQPKAGQ